MQIIQTLQRSNANGMQSFYLLSCGTPFYIKGIQEYSHIWNNKIERTGKCHAVPQKAGVR
jgi:hypothetical protein